MIRSIFICLTLFLSYVYGSNAADILRPRLAQTKTFPIGNDSQGGVTALVGKYPQLSESLAGNLNPYTGNASRVVRDVSVASVGEISLEWVRFNNSRIPTGTRKFGTEGNWRHNYQWDLSYTPASVSITRSGWAPPVVTIPPFSDGKGTITIAYPDGSVNTFKETGVFTGVFTCGSSEVTDYIIIQGSYSESRRAGFYNDYTEFRLVTSDNHRYNFGLNGTDFFINSIGDSRGQVTTISYSAPVGVTNGPLLIQRITEPGGRYIQLQHQNFTYTIPNGLGIGGTRTISNYFISSVTSSDGRIVTYQYAQRNTGSNGTKDYFLESVGYPQSQSATYSYQIHNNASSGASLKTARDIYADGIPNVKYTYWAQQAGYSTAPLGCVQKIEELDTLAVVCELGLVVSENNENAPVVSFLDGSGIGYLIKSSSGGLIDSSSNISDHSSSVVYTSNAAETSIVTTNSNNEKLGMTRSSLGRILSRNWPKVEGQTNTPTETWTYNDDGYLLTYKNTLDRTISITRNTENLATRIDYPDSSFEMFTYGPFKQIATHVNRNNGTTIFTYYTAIENNGTSNGLLKSVEDPTGRKTTYVYDSRGRVESVIDAANHVTGYEYDIAGRVIKVTFPSTVSGQAGATNLYGYDNRGNLTTFTNELSKTWTSTFDKFNRLETSTGPQNRITRVYYDPLAPNNSSPVKVVSDTGKIVTITYKAGWKYLPHVVTTAPGTSDESRKTYEYDGNDNIVKVVDALENEWIMSYDARDRFSSLTDPSGSRTDFVYDDEDNLIREVTPDGSTVLSYDNMNRVISRVDPKLQIVTIEYNKLDLPKLYTEPGNKIHEFTYDQAGRLLNKKFPDQTSEKYTYNDIGEVETFGTRDDRFKTLTYDSRYRVKTTMWSDNVTPSTSMEYDAASRLISISNVNSVITYNYSDANEIISEAQQITGLSDIKETQYEYDGDGRLKKLTYPDQTVLDYDYDARGLPSIIKQQGQTLATFTHDAAGNRIGRSLKNGVQTTLVYDDLQRLISVADVSPAPVGSTTLQRINYGYDSMSRRKYAKRENGRGDTYNYDTTGQLTTVLYDATNPDSQPSDPSRTVTYQFDGNGSRTSVFDKLSTESTGLTALYTPDLNNRYGTAGFANLSYDGRGNLAEISDTGPTSTRKLSCIYDAEDRLLTAENNFDATALNQFYDPVGRCVKRIENGVVTYLLHDVSWHLLSEYDSSGLQTVRYAGGIATDEIISRTDAEGNSIYYHTDGLGCVTKLTNSLGEVIESYQYDVYGNPKIVNASGVPVWKSSFGNRFLFTGREYLYSLGVYDYRSRIYDPSIGRFWQPDPIGHEGDASNIYRYCGNDPVNFTDPSGLYSVTASFYFNWTAAYINIFNNQNWNTFTNYNWAIGYANNQNYAAYHNALSNAGVAYKYVGGGAKLQTLREVEYKKDSAWRNVAGFVPVLGSGLDAYDSFKSGNWGMGILHTALAVSDLSGAGAIVKTLGKVALKTAGKTIAKKAVAEAVTKTVVHSTGKHVLPATTIRTISKGEKIVALEKELAELTYTSGGLEHAVISLKNGTRTIVSGGRGGIEFGNDLKKVIGHTHPTPTGPSAADFQMLIDTKQKHSYIYELFGGGRTRFNVK